MSLRARAQGAILRALTARDALPLTPPRRLTFAYRADDPYAALLLRPAMALGARLGAPRVLILAPFAEDPEATSLAAYARGDAAWLARCGAGSLPQPLAAPDARSAWLATRVLLAARAADRFADGAAAVADAVWSGDAAALEACAAQFGCVHERQARAETARDAETLARLGHYQAGMLGWRGAWYWGVDRLPLLAARVGMPELAPRFDPAAAPDRVGDGPLDFFFSFRSPYSYLAVERVRALAAAADRPLAVRCVLPMVMRGHRVPLAKRLYIVRDTAREARRLGIPFGRLADPLGGGVERALAVWHWAEDRDMGLAWIASAARGIWAEAADLTDDAELMQLAARAGLDGREAATVAGEAMAADAPWRTRVEANGARLRDLGLWGVPSFAVGDWAVWGQDRLSRVAAALGVDPRPFGV